MADVLPPHVSITTPDERQIDLEQDQLTIQASAQPIDNDPVTGLRLIVDGRPWGDPQPPAANDPQIPATGQWTVPLAAGKHQIVVKAETADSYGLSKPLLVNRARAADADSAAATGKLYVLAIGADPPAAAGAPADGPQVQKLIAALEQQGQGQFKEVITVPWWAPRPRPRRSKANWPRSSQMSPIDTGVIYFAGQDSLDSAGNYLLGGSATAAGSEVQAASLPAQLAAIPGRLVLLLDLTHSAEHARQQAAGGFCGHVAQGDSGRHIEDEAAEWIRGLLTEDVGVAVIANSRAAGSTAGRSSAGLSPLVQSLLEGLGGAADANRNGTIDVRELGADVTVRVRALTKSEQTPTVELPRGVNSFPLGKTAAPAPPGP